MRTTFVGLAVIGCVLASAPLMAVTNNEMSVLKTGYAAQRARIDGAYGQQATNAFTAYRQAVDARRMAVKEQGDLDGYVALTAEKNRLVAETTVNTDNVPALAAVVAQYQKMLLDAANARDQARLNLQRLYIDRLTALMQSATRADRLDDATAVRKELLLAQSDLVFLEADAPKPPGVAPSPAQPPAPPDYAKTLPGTWKFSWNNKGRTGVDTIMLRADGTAFSPKDGATGQWEIKETQCLIHWERAVNTMTIVADGARMIGHTQLGVSLSATKSGP